MVSWISAIGGLGPTELLFIFLILVMIFGASRLPKLGEAVGKSIRSLKRGLNTDDDIEVAPKQVPEASTATTASEAEKVSEAEIVEKP